MTPAALTLWRQHLGLSKRELAEALGVHPVTVSNWERGAAAIQTPVMLSLALEALERRATDAYETLRNSTKL